MNKYKDLHNHILFGIDDGSKTIGESVSIIKKMKNFGYADIILTPHYMNNTSYNANNSKKNMLFDILKEELKNNNIDINIYLGNEVYIDLDIINLVKNNEITTLNKSKYILIEFNRDTEFIFYESSLKELIKSNYVPIIAHPERYSYFSDESVVKKYIEMGCLLQGNIQSMVNKYSKSAKERFLYLLKNKFYTFLSTDAHDMDDISNIEYINSLVQRETDEKYFNEITYSNIEKVINNENI